MRTGSYVYTAGQLPVVDGKLLATGKVGAEIGTAEAAALARTCALNALAAVTTVTGGLIAIVRIVKVTGFVASDVHFTEQAQVINGASELLIEVFGEAGLDARSAVGVAVLPLDAPVEVELIAEVRDLPRPPGPIRRSARVSSGARGPSTGPRREAAPRAAGMSSPSTLQAPRCSAAAAAPPRDAATVMLLRPPPLARPGRQRASRSTCCAASPPWRSLPAPTCSPAVGRHQGRRRAGGLGRARARRVGPDLRRPAATGPRAGMRRGAGDVRGVRGALAGPSADGWWPTRPGQTGRPTAWRCSTARSRWPSCSPGAAWCSGPTCSGPGPGGSRR